MKKFFELLSNSKDIFPNFSNIKKHFDEYKDLISLCPLNNWSIQQIIEISLNSSVKQYNRKEIAIVNKEKSNIFYSIIKGRVKVKNPITNKTSRINL